LDESQNQGNSSINISLQHANTTHGRHRRPGRRGQKQSRVLGNSQEQTSIFQNDQKERKEKVAKDGKVWSKIPSDTFSLERRQQHCVLKDVPGLSSFAIKNVTLGKFTSV